MNLPSEFTDRINFQPGINAGDLIRALEKPSPVSIRINRAKWQKEPEEAESVPWCTDAWYLEKRPSFTLDPLFHSGCYYPQEASGMFTGEAFRQVTHGLSDLRVLDLCGAPGGKSTHLASLIGNNGVLVANEVIRQRASVLSANLTRWGLPGVIVSSNDPSSFSRLAGYFDVILVDAPCSGEGMFRDQAAVSEWTPANTRLCCERQRRILMDVWPSLKEGGFLIYSTCTFNPAENEENIKWLLENRSGESTALDLSGFGGIVQVKLNGVTGYGFYPDRIKGEGFFLSVIKKTEETKGVYKTQKGRPTLKENRKVAGKLLSVQPPLALQLNNRVYAVPLGPDEYLMLSSVLKIIRTGTCLCELKGEEIVPSHELALSVILSRAAYTQSELSADEAVAYLRKENVPSSHMENGWNLLKYRDVPIGFAKVIGTRMNNYFPVEWRIRMNPSSAAVEIVKWK